MKSRSKTAKTRTSRRREEEHSTQHGKHARINNMANTQSNRTVEKKVKNAPSKSCMNACACQDGGGIPLGAPSGKPTKHSSSCVCVCLNVFVCVFVCVYVCVCVCVCVSVGGGRKARPATQPNSTHQPASARFLLFVVCLVCFVFPFALSFLWFALSIQFCVSHIHG